VPAQRAITLRDLLTSTMGFGSIMAMPDTYPIQKLIREYRIGGDGPMLPTQAPGMDEWLQKLGSLPWLTQPGERWMYHVSIDALGALIARAKPGSRRGRFWLVGVGSGRTCFCPWFCFPPFRPQKSASSRPKLLTVS